MYQISFKLEKNFECPQNVFLVDRQMVTESGLEETICKRSHV